MCVKLKARKLLFILFYILCYLVAFKYCLFFLQAKAFGRVLFEQVCKQLHLLEADYFGLEYSDLAGTRVSSEKIIKLNVIEKIGVLKIVDGYNINKTSN